MPPFTVRNASMISQNITSYAAPEGFINIPIHTYIDGPLSEDNLGYTNCHYEFTSEETRKINNTLF